MTQVYCQLAVVNICNSWTSDDRIYIISAVLDKINKQINGGMQETVSIRLFGWLGRAMVLGNFQCRGVLLLWHMVGQGPAVLAAGAGWVGYVFFVFFF